MRKYYDSVIITESGRPLEGAIIVAKQGGTPVTIYSDDGLTEIDTLTTDSEGYFEFYVPDGEYTIEYQYGGAVYKTIPDVQIYDLSTISSQWFNGDPVFYVELVDGDYTHAAENQTRLNALAAAITGLSRAVVRFGAGTFNYTGGVNPFTCDNIVIEGCGKGATQLIHTSATAGGLTIKPTSSTPTVMLSRATVRGITFFGGATDPTAGAALTLERCQEIDIDIEIGGSFIGLDVASCRGGNVRTKAAGGSNFTSAKTGSALRRWRQISGGVLPAEIHIAGGEARGNHASVNSYLQFCDLIQAADGLFFESYHGGFAKHTLALIPETATSQLTGIKAELWSDSTTVSGVVCRYDGAGTYSGQFGLHRITITNGYDTPKAFHCKLVSSTAANNLPSQLNVGQIHHVTNIGIDFETAQNWVLTSGCDIEDTVIGVQLGAAASDIILHPGRVRRGQGGSDVSHGIYIVDGAADFRILAGWEFEGCTLDISDNATSTDKTIGTITTDKGHLYPRRCWCGEGRRGQ